MKKIAEIIEKLDMLMERERSIIAEHGVDNYLGSVSAVVKEAYEDLKEWILT